MTNRLRKKVVPESTHNERYAALNPQFTPLPGLALGATDSAHGVFFGRENGRDVAVKPYVNGDDPHGKAEHERRMYDITAGLGFLTLKPVKVIFDGTRHAYLVTEHDPNLVSLLSVSPGSQGYFGLIRGAAATLGRFHSAGMIHGDAQVKNFGANRGQVEEGLPGQTMIFDFERTGPTESVSDHRTHSYDLGKLSESLAFTNFGNTYNLDLASAALEHHVLDPWGEQARVTIPQKEIDRAKAEAYTRFIDRFTARLREGRHTSRRHNRAA
ncbi:hypothetical protein HYW35_02410 [Candidatus Saccharibacteria bacterium]|nr:hypothetical protein [Candidatus Saccharibacteria bacterium]